MVTIYRGVDASLPGIDLAQPYETSNVTLDRLSDFEAQNVREGIDAASLADARDTVESLAQNMSPRRGPGRLRRGGGALMSQSGFVMGFVHRRRRGAELLLLVLALAVGIGAYAAVGIGVQGEVPPDIIGYGAGLAVLAIGAHLAVRLVAPYADPVLLPVVTALNGLGLAVIHRLDLVYQDLPHKPQGLPQKQLTWMAVGVVLFVVTLLLLRDHRVLTRFTYTSGLGAIALLLLPMVPGVGSTINGAKIWISVGPFSFQPGEVAKVLLVVAFAGYLVLHRDALALAGRRVAGIDLPRGRDLGPVLAMWLVSLGILVFQRDLGSSLLFFGLFLVMLYVATERAGWLVVGGVLFLGGAAVAYQFLGHVQNRVNIWLDPMAYFDKTPGQRPAGRVAVRDGLGRADRPRLRRRQPRAGAVRGVRLHHRRDRRGARAHRRDGGDHLLRPHRRARPARGADLPRRVRQADGDRAGRGPRAPGLRRHRRRDPADPAHRPDHAVPLLRRLVARRQLGDRRAPAAHLRPGPPAGAGPLPGRGRRRRTSRPPRW